MKIKEWLKSLLAGMAIGLGTAIPGVSGGTVAVILKVYEKILWAISNIFKQFKKAIIYLLPVLIGLVVAIVPTIYVMDKALDGFLFAVICLFAGFILGSIPGITDEVKGKPVTKKEIITLVISAIIAIGLGVGSVLVKKDLGQFFIDIPVWLYFVMIPVGFIAAIALVVPGVSGGMLLLLLGFYKPLINTAVDAAKNLFNGNWSTLGPQIGLLACLLVGILVGFYLISRLMNFLLHKYHLVTFYSIIGFVSGSVIALFFNYQIYAYYQMWANGATGDKAPYLAYYIEIPIGIVLLIAGLIGSYMLVRYKRKQQAVEEGENTSIIE